MTIALGPRPAALAYRDPRLSRLTVPSSSRQTERLQRLFEAVSDELSLPPGRVCLGQRDVIYSPHQTPEEVRLGPFDMIDMSGWAYRIW